MKINRHFLQQLLVTISCCRSPYVVCLRLFPLLGNPGRSEKRGCGVLCVQAGVCRRAVIPPGLLFIFRLYINYELDPVTSDVIFVTRAHNFGMIEVLNFTHQNIE